MKDKTWLEQQESAFWKKWNENLIKLHCKMYRLGNEVNNENTSLWNQLRRDI